MPASAAATASSCSVCFTCGFGARPEMLSSRPPSRATSASIAISAFAWRSAMMVVFIAPP